MALNIIPAQPEDIPELVQLINSAYRGESSKKGWTTEAELIQGAERTDEDTLRVEMAKPGATILKCVNDTGGMEGCVFLETSGGRMYLGMLTVSPEQQGAGIGKLMLQAAEVYASAQQCRSIYMSVISVRHELVAWYMRHGYHPNGETRPFPTDNKFGTPVQDLVFVMLEKEI